MKGYRLREMRVGLRFKQIGADKLCSLPALDNEWHAQRARLHSRSTLGFKNPKFLIVDWTTVITNNGTSLFIEGYSHCRGVVTLPKQQLSSNER